MNSFPQILNEKYCDYKIIKDTEGMSPAEVYKIESSNKIIYLKRSKTVFSNTTYDVKREMNVIKWISGKISTPQIIHYEENREFNSLLMTHVGGNDLESLKQSISFEHYIDYYVQSLHKIQSIGIEGCPYDNCIDNRLKELEYLLENNLADVEPNNWEEETIFANSRELHEFLVKNKPDENQVFSHGDMNNSNIFIENGMVKFIDLGRCGLADKWLDIAFCIRDIKESSDEEKWINLFFSKLGIKPDWEKINYYILLDELF